MSKSVHLGLYLKQEPLQVPKSVQPGLHLGPESKQPVVEVEPDPKPKHPVLGLELEPEPNHPVLELESEPSGTPAIMQPFDRMVPSIGRPWKVCTYRHPNLLPPRFVPTDRPLVHRWLTYKRSDCRRCHNPSPTTPKVRLVAFVFVGRRNKNIRSHRLQPRLKPCQPSH